jgi:cytochrome c5
MRNFLRKTCLLVFMSIYLIACSTTTKPASTAAPFPAGTQLSIPTDTQSFLPTNTLLPEPTDTEPMSPTETEAQLPPTEALPSISGATLLDNRCTVCHSKSKVTGTSKTYDGWDQTVNRMVLKGAALSPEEVKILVEYLAQTYK